MAREPKVSEEHPELHHYTDWNGLKGIFTSQTLWATHFSKLNDYTEINHLEDALVKAVTDKLEAYANFRCLTEPDFRESMARMGDIRGACEHDTKNSISSIYDVTFRGREIDENTKIIPFVEPFITSFCSHTRDSPYEVENGLLSQWTRYGRNEGYAMVFDTVVLEERLTEEFKSYGYQFFGFYDVVYNDENLNFVERFSEEISKVFEITRDFIFNPDDVRPFDAFEPLVRAATRFKHRAFKEEREIRIVACPARRDHEDTLKAEYPNLYEDLSFEFKKIHAEPKNHICLFDSDSSHVLPIKRIIVGPAKEQERCIEKIKELVDGSIPIVCSETPYQA